MPDGMIESEKCTLPRWARRLITVALLFHLTAIVIAPASVAPSSGLIQQTWLLFRPYLQALYLNHGYHYFAPQPGESTLLAFTIEWADGETIEGHIPDRSTFPRLLYHRYFMLTEQMPYAPSPASGFVTPQEAAAPQSEDQPAHPALVQDWYRSYAQCLLRKYNGSRVTLRRVVHYLPSMEMVIEGASLDEPASFEEQPLGTFTCEQR